MDFGGAVVGQEGQKIKAKVVFVLPRVVLPFDILQAPFITIMKDGEEGIGFERIYLRTGGRGLDFMFSGIIFLVGKYL